MNLSLTKTDTAVVKGIAILAMLMHHVFTPLTEQSWIIDQLQSIGKVCVALFVLLSGYGMAVGYQRINVSGGGKDYSQNIVLLLIRRLLKFYMNYWVIFLIFVPLGVFVFGRPIDAGYQEGVNAMKFFVWDVLGIAGFQSYNITWWFNKLILILYVLSPVVYIFTKTIPIGSFLVVFFMQRIKVLGDAYWLNVYLIPFVLGFVWAQNAEQVSNKLHKVPKWLGILLALILLGMIAYCRQIGFLISALEWDTYLAVAITLLVLVCKPYRLKSNTILGFLGKHSMNIYMVHTFVFAYFWRDEIYSLDNPWLILFVVLVISLSISIAIEFMKNKTHYNQISDKLYNFMTNKIV